MSKTTVNQYLSERRSDLVVRLHGQNLKRLAAFSGISRSTLWRIREGITDADPDTIDAVEAALDQLPGRTETAA